MFLQALGFGKFSLLGWSDGGITALIAAAKSPEMISKMVVWGSNAFVSQHDLELYEGTSTLLFIVFGNCHCSPKRCELCMV